MPAIYPTTGTLSFTIAADAEGNCDVAPNTVISIEAFHVAMIEKYGRDRISPLSELPTKSFTVKIGSGDIVVEPPTAEVADIVSRGGEISVGTLNRAGRITPDSTLIARPNAE